MTARPLHLVLLGQGKTGSLVAEVAAERGHRTTIITEVENEGGAWLTPDNLRDADAVIDFTTPEAVLANIAGCVAAKKADGGGNDRLVRRNGTGAAGS